MAKKENETWFNETDESITMRYRMIDGIFLFFFSLKLNDSGLLIISGHLIIVDVMDFVSR